MPTCHSLDEGPKAPHALAPADALLQQPPVSTLPVQQLCCQRESAEHGTGGAYRNTVRELWAPCTAANLKRQDPSFPCPRMLSSPAPPMNCMVNSAKQLFQLNSTEAASLY